MQTRKKGLMYLGILLASVAAGLVFVGHKAMAVTPDNKYLSACVIDIISPDIASRSENQLLSKLCRVDSQGSGPINVYGGLEANEDLKTATYKASTTMNKLTSNGVTLSVPLFIQILDSSGQNPLFSGNLADRNAACGTLTHSSLVGNTQDQFTGTEEPYIVYRASGTTLSSQYTCNNTTFLVTLNKDGTLELTAVVFDTVQSGNFVYAANISKPVLGTSAVSPTGGGSAQPSCGSNFNSPLAWIICPALGIADSAAEAFGGFVEDQLCFKTTTTATSSTGSSIVCKGNNNLDGGVHNAWNIFKNIASALLVIIMLAMVLSQAIGGGPFDAYTVRKMLPKLVAAVIIMQLSWVLLKWAIDLSNDVGAAIGNLMEAPFGGASQLTLKHMVGVDLSAHSTDTNNTIGFFGLLAAGVGGIIVSIPGLALMALYVVLALLTAFVVLLFRKLLIVLLVILAPVAIIMWILPGTQRYWKMWQDNFMKLVMMFPIIMGIIAAGRIFASITAGNSAVMFHIHPAVAHLGPLSVPYIATFSNFADLAIIIGAFFGPYFFLPQTFKWGGTALGAVGKGVPQALERMGGKQAKDYLQWRQGLSPWKQARAARRAKQEIRAKTEFYDSLGTRGPLGMVRRARLRGIPPVGRREDALVDSIVRGGAQRAEAEALKEANEALEFELSTNPDAIADHDQYVIDIARAGVGANVHGRVRNEADWRAAVEKMIQYGGPNNRVFEELHQQYLSGAMGEEGRAQYEKVINGVAPQVLSKFPFFYKDRDYSVRVDERGNPRAELGDLSTTISQLSPDSFTKDAGIEAEAVETIMGHLSVLIREGDVALNPAATPEQINLATRAREQVTTMYALFNQAISSESAKTRINPSSARAMRAALGLNPRGLATINGGRRGRGPGVPEIDSTTIARTVMTSGDPDMPGAVRNIVDNVRNDGNLST